MSQNWLEIYIHVFILQVMKSQLLVIHYKTCTCIYDTRTRRFYKIQCNLSFSREIIIPGILKKYINYVSLIYPHIANDNTS